MSRLLTRVLQCPPRLTVLLPLLLQIGVLCGAGFQAAAIAQESDALQLAQQLSDTTKFRTVLIEFHDASGSHLSEPLTYLWYRQLYLSVSDVRGASIIRLVPPDGSYGTAHGVPAAPHGSHDSAAEIAGSVDAQIALWGVLALTDDAQVTMAASLTVPGPPTASAGWSNLPDGSPDWRSLPVSPLARSVGISPPAVRLDRLNFSPTTVALRDLYGEKALVQCARDSGCGPGQIRLLDQPHINAHGTNLEEGETLSIAVGEEGRQPKGKFVPVRRDSDGQRGWIYSYYLDLMPGEVFVTSATEIRGFSAPAPSSASGRPIQGPVFLRVLQTRVIGSPHSAKRWYEVVARSGEHLWVDRGDVHTVWPAQHINFVSGLIHYALGQYQAAFGEFEAFVLRADPNEENVAVSRAYQLMAASLLATSTKDLGVRNDTARSLMDHAVALTPYDSRSVALRAYTLYAWPQSGTERSDTTRITADLNDAIALNSRLGNAEGASHELDQLSATVHGGPPNSTFVPSFGPRAPPCRSPLGTLYVAEPEHIWWETLKLEAPGPFIMTLVKDSQCFSLKSATIAPSRAQLTDVDYILVPEFGQLSAAGHPRNPSQGEQWSWADVVLTLRDARSSQVLGIVQGHARNAPIASAESTVAQMDRRTSKDTTIDANAAINSAYVDAYFSMLSKLGVSNGNGIGKVPFDTTGLAQGVVVLRPGHLHARPDATSPEIRDLDPGTLLVATGTRNGNWWNVRDGQGTEGWISADLFQYANVDTR